MNLLAVILISASTITIFSFATHGEISLACSYAFDQKNRATFLLDDSGPPRDWSKNQALVADFTNQAEGEITVALAFSTGIGQLWFESAPVVLNPGLNSAIRFELAGNSFKLGPTGQEYMELLFADQVHYCAFVFSGWNGLKSTVYIDNIWLVSGDRTNTGSSYQPDESASAEMSQEIMLQNRDYVIIDAENTVTTLHGGLYINSRFIDTVICLDDSRPVICPINDICLIEPTMNRITCSNQKSYQTREPLQDSAIKSGDKEYLLKRIKAIIPREQYTKQNSLLKEYFAYPRNSTFKDSKLLQFKIFYGNNFYDQSHKNNFYSNIWNLRGEDKIHSIKAYNFEGTLQGKEIAYIIPSAYYNRLTNGYGISYIDPDYFEGIEAWEDEILFITQPGLEETAKKEYDRLCNSSGPQNPLYFQRLEDLNLKRALQETYSRSELFYLENLSLPNQEITRISGLAGLINLKYLDLSGNRISRIEGLTGISGLESINLSRNPITEIKGLDGLTKLDSLVLSYCLIKEMTGLTDLENLNLLDLSSNQINQGDFRIKQVNLPGSIR